MRIANTVQYVVVDGMLQHVPYGSSNASSRRILFFALSLASVDVNQWWVASGFTTTTTTNNYLQPYHQMVAPSSSSRPSTLARHTALSNNDNNNGTNNDTNAAETATPPVLPPLSPPTAKRLFLVRHGEVVNPGGPDCPVYYGAMDVPLSALGEQEAAAAGLYLQQFPLARVFTSPLRRAVYGATSVLEHQQQQQQVVTGATGTTTAVAAAAAAGRADSLVVLDGFKELDRGDWCGKTKSEIGADQMQRFDAGDETVTPANGGESYRELKQRVLAARSVALDLMRPGEMACVVSHLQVTRCLLSDATGAAVSEMASLKVATASVTCIDYDWEDDGSGSGSTIKATIHFQSFKPSIGLPTAMDGAN